MIESNRELNAIILWDFQRESKEDVETYENNNRPHLKVSKKIEMKDFIKD